MSPGNYLEGVTLFLNFIITKAEYIHNETIRTKKIKTVPILAT